jgi:hypothetical protein
MTSVDLEPHSMKGFFFNVLCMEHPNSITPTKMVLTITYSLHKLAPHTLMGIFYVLCTENPNTITPTKNGVNNYFLHKVSSTHIEGFFF